MLPSFLNIFYPTLSSVDELSELDGRIDVVELIIKYLKIDPIPNGLWCGRRNAGLAAVWIEGQTSIVWFWSSSECLTRVWWCFRQVSCYCRAPISSSLMVLVVNILQQECLVKQLMRVVWLLEKPTDPEIVAQGNINFMYSSILYSTQEARKSTLMQAKADQL